MTRTYSQIDMDERRRIARWRMAGIGVEIIAEKLGRHRSTSFREIKRNTFVDPQMPDLSGYYCVTANAMARERRAKLRKLARFADLRQSIIERIMHGWSPQQIAGRMRLEVHSISKCDMVTTTLRGRRHLAVFRRQHRRADAGHPCPGAIASGFRRCSGERRRQSPRAWWAATPPAVSPWRHSNPRRARCAMQNLAMSKGLMSVRRIAASPHSAEASRRDLAVHRDRQAGRDRRRDRSP